MANEWYVQHGGKQVGPLTSATLKKLAAEGKIAPTTTVRLGTDGNWVPASRVQGLFAAAPTPVAPSAMMPPAAPKRKTAPLVAPLAAPPVSPPAAPVMPTAMAQAPWARGAALPKAIPAGGISLTTKVIGGVGIILGAVAFVVVVAYALGLFDAVPPQIAQKSALPPAAPVPVVTVEKEPELAPPEPEWVDASKAILQGDIKATIVSAKVENVRLESGDLSRLGKQKSQPMLKINLAIENTAQDKIIEVSGWQGGSELPAGLGDLVGGELGKAVQSTSATVVLTDNFGNKYKQTPTMMLFGNTVTVGKDNAVRPGKSAASDLVFPPPLETIEYLRIELSPAGFGGTDPLRFQIPKAMITGLGTAIGG